MNQQLPSTIVGRAARVARAKALTPLRLVVGLLLFGSLTVVAALSAGLLARERVTNQTVIMPLSPPSSSAWTVENAFPQLTFFEPTCVVRHATSGRVFVLERRGTVQVFNEDAADEKQQILDISDQVWRTEYEDDGAMGIVLHPEFGTTDSPNCGSFYLFYTAKADGKRYDRLTRFTLENDQARDETVLIDQLDDNIWHNGGALAFGPDGFLYVGVGDEGTDGDGLSNGQRIDRDFFCGILRIDVDEQGGNVSHPPVRQPDSGRTANYFIPNDNPFVQAEGALEEFWAHGLRNPFRIAFDKVTGKLWAADVGHLRREEINLIERGGNYGWSYLEGRLPFAESYLEGKKPESFVGTEKFPLRDYPHLNGDNCIIGGFVYRGKQYPALQGKYLYGDNGSGRLWALEERDGTAGDNIELLSLPVSSKTGVSAIVEGKDGEPWIVVLGESGTTSGTIHRVVPAEPGSSTTLPATLSATGIFEDLRSLTPSDGVIEYGLNAGQSLGAVSVRRWLMLPGNGCDPDPAADRIAFAPDGAWTFPTGSVFVQNIELNQAASESGLPRRLETRVLVRHAQGGVYGATYRWNQAGTDAQLLTSPTSEFIEASPAAGSAGTHWHYLSNQSCLACHNQNAGYVLGVNTRQLNRSIRLPGQMIASSQLATWSKLGMFQNELANRELTSAERLTEPSDSTADIDLRARSFLDVNCAACHRPGGARANFQAGFAATGKFDFANALPTQGDFGIEQARVIAPGHPQRSMIYYRLAKLGPGRMPFVGSQRLDIEALDLIRTWIEQLPETPATSAVPPELANKWKLQRESLERVEQGELGVPIESLLADTHGGFALWQLIYDARVPENIEADIIEAGIDSPNPSVRDLFEWLVPADERTQRLGTQFDPTDVLVLSGDVRRGHEMFETLSGLDCRSCHALKREEELIGPSLWGIGDKYDRPQLLDQILDPSKEVDPRFRTWLVETNSGRIHSGLKVIENDREIVLKDATGKLAQIPADDIDVVETMPKSLMPEQLLQSLTAQQAADLLSFLQSLKKDGGTLQAL